MPIGSPRGFRRRFSAPSLSVAALGSEAMRGAQRRAQDFLPVAGPPSATRNVDIAPTALVLRPPATHSESPRGTATDALALAPELSAEGLPFLVGSVYAGAGGQLFDGSRCAVPALRRHLRGAPLHPNVVANALLARIAADPRLTAEAFRAAVAATLLCPLTGTVPHDGAHVRIGLGDGAECTAVADGDRLELTTAHDVMAGRLASGVGTVRTILPCGDAVVLLDDLGRVHLYANVTEARPGWPAGSLAPLPLPALLDSRQINLIAAGDTLWAAAAADGAIAKGRCTADPLLCGVAVCKYD